MKTSNLFFVLLVSFGCTGCAHLEKFDAKLDMAAEHLSGAKKPFYEGQLRASQQIGPMTSLQFADGRIIDVSEAPAGLEFGDTVRVYRTDDGYIAHLWHSAAEEPPSP